MVEVAVSTGECLCPLMALRVFIVLKVVDEVLLIAVLIPKSLPCMLK